MTSYASDGYVANPAEDAVVKKTMAKDSNDYLINSDPSVSKIYPEMSFCRSDRLKVKQGIIMKQCPSMPVLWQERFFVLKADASIHYFVNVRCIKLIFE